MTDAAEEEVYLKDVPFEKAEAQIRAILADIDAGKFDTELAEAGIAHDSKVKLATGVRLEQSQGLAPEAWYVISATLPAATYAAKTLWDKVIIPKLQQVFHVDRVSRSNPRKRK
jgi:hypothetical protein